MVRALMGSLPSIAAKGRFMSCTCVVGLQWGDEAKGKIVDLLADRHDFVVRYNGGANAGHTVVSGGKTFKLSLLPTGVLKPHVRSVIANGVVVSPPKFLEEVEGLRQAGIKVGDNLALSDHAHVIFPYHGEEERLTEQGSGKAIGTTGRGIGPCYQDKVGRGLSVRVGELLDAHHLRERLGAIVAWKNRLLRGLAPDAKTFDASALTEEYLSYAAKMRPFITDTTRLLLEARQAGKKILFEGAQGSLLDVDHGTYPFVTSSNSSPAGIWNGSGFSARHLDRIIGIVKAYCSRVGGGPFPTELNDGPTGLGQRIRERGREYGTVTGRPRRCGWFDVVAARYSADLADADELAVMLLDVLSGFDSLQICTAYEYEGERITHFSTDAFVLERCKPVYETLPGWREDLTAVRRLADFPVAARRYIDRLGELLDRPIKTVSIGPDREQTIFS
jgi:adenylosuccinate synthase